jgi:hypothetical protein
MLRPALLRLKPWVAGAGFLVGLMGMAFDLRWLVWVGVGLLSVAFILRFGARDPQSP